MSELRFKIHTSADGFVGKLDGDVDWVFPTMTGDDMSQWEVDLLWDTDLHLMGRVLYEDMAPYWPTSDTVHAPPMNEIPKAIFSNTLTEAPWADDNVLRGDLAEEVGKLKAASEKGVLLHGGASFGRELATLGLIDEWVLVQHPVVLGEGLPIFAEEHELEVTDRVLFDSGAIAVTYRHV